MNTLTKTVVDFCRSPWAYAAIAVAFALVWYHPVQVSNQYGQVVAEREASLVPAISLSDIKERAENLSLAVQSTTEWSAKHYFGLLTEQMTLELVSRQYDRNPSLMADQSVYELRDARIALADTRFGENDLAIAANEWFRNRTDQEILESDAEREIHRQHMRQYDADTSDSPVGKSVRDAFVLGMPIAFLCHLLRLWRSKKKVLAELFAPDIWIWTLFYPVGLLKYPTYIVTGRQLRRIKKWAGAILGAALSVSPMAMAQPKAPVKLAGNSKNELVIEDEEEKSILDYISFESSDKQTQILPTLVWGEGEDEIMFDLFGWSTGICEDVTKACGVAQTRTRAVVTTDSWQIFSQFNMLDTSLEDGSAVDQLWFGKRINDGINLEIGRIFLSAAYAAPAPFLQETITDPPLPAVFFASGVRVFGSLNDQWSYSFDLTGLKGTTAFSSDQFDEVGFSGFIKRDYGSWFSRLSVQQSGDLRLIADAGWESDLYSARGALHYRTEGHQVGAYVFGQRKLTDRLSAFTQLDWRDEIKSLFGIRYSANDHLAFTGEVNGEGAQLRLVAQF